MFKLSFVLLFLALGHSVHAQVILAGKCKPVKYLTEFDLANYTGTWYEYAKYPSFFETDQKCNTAQYSDLGDGEVGVTNTAFYEGANSTIAIQGSAEVLGPGLLAVVFGETNMESPTQNYAVLGTDYKSWAFVYSCQEMGFFRTEYAWILTRERTPSPAAVASAKQVMNENGISEAFLVDTDQVDCSEVQMNTLNRFGVPRPNQRSFIMAVMEVIAFIINMFQ